RRECLFKVVRIRRDVRKDLAHEDGPPLEALLIEELAAAVPELTHRRRAQRALLAVRPTEAPLVGLRVVEAQRQTFDVTPPSVDFDLLQLGAAVPDLADADRPMPRDPGGGARQRMFETPDVGLPAADVEVESVF